MRDTIARRTFLGTSMTGVVSIAGCLGVGGGSGPDQPVREYFAAVSNGDQERAEQQFHEDAMISPNVDESGSEINIQNVEEHTAEDYVEHYDSADSASQVRSNVEGWIEGSGVEEWTYVYVVAVSDGREFDRHFLVVKHDGEWLIFA